MTTLRPTIAQLVTAGLDRSTAAIHCVPYVETQDPAVHVRRCERLHRLYARRARWWAVLERAATTDPAIPLVYVRAVVHARCTADRQADDWALNADLWTEQTRAPLRGVSA